MKIRQKNYRVMLMHMVQVTISKS